MLQLKERWVECTTYTRCSQKFEVPQSAVPPIMAPSMRRPVLLNTEHKKKSIVLESLKQKYTGDPALLHDIISKEGVDVSSLNLMSGECVKDICKKCNIPTSQKSLVIFALLTISNRLIHQVLLL